MRIGSVELEFEVPAGDRLANRYGKDLRLVREYTENGWLRSQALVVEEAGGPRTVYEARYEYDRDQFLIREQNSFGESVDYELDRAGRVLARITSNNGRIVHEERLRYDAGGTPIPGGVSLDALGRPAQRGNETFAYDGAGRLIQRTADEGVWSYEYNSLDQLVSVKCPAGEVGFDYDARGRLMRRRLFRDNELVSDKSFVWSVELLMYEIDNLTGTSRTYIRQQTDYFTWGHVDTVAGEQQLAVYLLGPSGSIECAFDGRGNLVWKPHTRSVYGDYQLAQEDTAISLRLVNQYFDPEVRLAYNRMRWYDPSTGVFTSIDPLFLRGNVNPREYAPNPYFYIDPSGLFTHPGVGTGTGTTTGGATNPGATGGSGFHPTPDGPYPGPGGRPAAPGAITNTPASGNYLSFPGHFAVGPGGANGNTTPGCVPCPASVLNPGQNNFGADNDPTSTQGMVNAAGNTYGCHSCGSRDSGYGDRNGVQHWTCDHQPPRGNYNATTAKKGGTLGTASNTMAQQPGAVMLYPHCANCSKAQKDAVGRSLAGPGGRELGGLRGWVAGAHNRDYFPGVGTAGPGVGHPFNSDDD